MQRRQGHGVRTLTGSAGQVSASWTFARLDYFACFNYNGRNGHLELVKRFFMKTMPAAQAKTKFGFLIDTAQREPVTISKKGRPVAVMMSMQEYEKHEALKLDRLRSEVQKGLDQLNSGEAVDGKPFMESLIEKLD